MSGRLAAFGCLLALGIGVLPELVPTGPTGALGAAGYLEAGHFALGAAVIFAGGLLTALTPCVYPLIPITVSVFGVRKGEGRGRSFLLTGAYVVGMGIVFSALGVLAAKTGQAFGSTLGDPRVAIALACLLVLLALSMFGAFELALPAPLATRLSGVGGAGPLGALLMGGVSGFIAAPCTGPVLAGLLAFVAKSQNTWLGASLLFVYALGIGVPFFLIGALALKLPRGGEWMEWVKSVLGIALLALAASYLRDAFPAVKGSVGAAASLFGRAPTAWLAAFLAFAGVLAGAIHLSFSDRARAFRKGVAVLVVVAATLLRMAALDGPTTGALWAHVGIAWAEPANDFAWQLHFPEARPARPEAFEAELERARREGRPVLVDFFAEWCAACKELDRLTYVAPGVQNESVRFVTIKVDGTRAEDEIDRLYDRFGVQGLPTVAFISSSGEILEEPRVTGFVGPEEFLALMKKVR